MVTSINAIDQIKILEMYSLYFPHHPKDKNEIIEKVLQLLPAPVDGKYTILQRNASWELIVIGGSIAVASWFFGGFFKELGTRSGAALSNRIFGVKPEKVSQLIGENATERLAAAQAILQPADVNSAAFNSMRTAVIQNIGDMLRDHGLGHVREFILDTDLRVFELKNNGPETQVLYTFVQNIKNHPDHLEAIIKRLHDTP